MGKKEDKPQITGAREKIRQAQMMHGKKVDIESKREGKGPDVITPLVMSYGLALALATLLTQGFFANPGVPFRVPDPFWHDILFGKKPYPFFEEPTLDKTAAIVIRGTFFFLLAGVIPILTKINRKALGRRGVALYDFWSVSVFMFFAVIGVIIFS